MENEIECREKGKCKAPDLKSEARVRRSARRRLAAAFVAAAALTPVVLAAALAAQLVATLV